MHYAPTVSREAKPAGIVDTLSAGYALINRQVWVLLVPLVVDLFLWLGPQISFAPLLEPIIAQAGLQLQAEGAPTSTIVLEEATGTGQDEMVRRLMDASREVNALALLARGPLGLPSVAGVPARSEPFRFVHDWSTAGALVAGSLAGGLVLGGLLRSFLAQQVREGAPDPLAASRRVPRALLRVVGLALLILGAALGAGVPLFLLLAIASALVPAAASIVVLVATAAILLAEVYLFFTLDAIFVSEVGPMAAIKRSVAMVRRHSWSTLGLILLSWLIVTGMDRVWELAAANLSRPLGSTLAIVGNAYIGTGLMAASMIFYKERVDPPVVAPSRS